jgi:hypothetical protein
VFEFDAYFEKGHLEQWAGELADEMVGQAQALLDLLGAEIIVHLRSLTDRTRPPVRKGEPRRAAHPGRWADVTGVMANSYAWQVEVDSDGGRVILSNSAEYAIYVDAMDGYFVLRGVTDRGGPVEEILRRVIAQVAPEWEVRYG